MNVVVIYEYLKAIMGLTILAIIITLLITFRVMYVQTVTPFQEIAMTMQIGRRQMAYAYYSGSLDIDTYKPLPRKQLAWQWDGFTLLGESVSRHYLVSTQPTGWDKYPLSTYLHNKGYTYKESVWNTAGVVFARVYVGGREIWISLKR